LAHRSSVYATLLDSGRGAIETGQIAEALGRGALSSMVFSVILLSGDPARAGAARARPEVACPGLKNLKPIAKLACLCRLVSTLLITLPALDGHPRKDAQRLRSEPDRSTRRRNRRAWKSSSTAR